MKKIIFLMPVYNDWKSIQKVFQEIDLVIKEIKNYEFKCIIVNDCSTEKKPKIEKPKNFNSLKIINMKENKGHARCNAFGLRYIDSNELYDYVIIMDSDGEDRPIEIKNLISKIEKEPEISVVAKRVKRSEGIVFQSLYQIHKFVTLIFTGRKINFGNYCCLTNRDVKKLSDKKSLWSSFSGSVKKYISNFNETDSIRGSRYFGPTKMSFFNLIIHSFSIIAVFKYTVFLRSSIMIIMLSLLITKLGFIAVTFQILIVLFNLIIFIVSKREKQIALLESNNNILDENDIIQ